MSAAEVFALNSLDTLPANSPSGRLVGQWLLNEGSDTIAFDTAGTHNGTIFGAIWTTDPPAALSRAPRASLVSTNTPVRTPNLSASKLKPTPHPQQVLSESQLFTAMESRGLIQTAFDARPTVACHTHMGHR